MRIVVGLKAHSGWAALVALGRLDGGLHVVERRRIELVDAETTAWAKQPYHAADGLDAGAAGALVDRAIDAARRVAQREMRAALARAHQAGHEVVACAVLGPAPMPGWSLAEILAVHIRMHKAEGVLFPDALVHAAQACGLPIEVIPEKELPARAAASTHQEIAMLGKRIGPPWGKDQKLAALAAMLALDTSPVPARA